MGYRLNADCFNEVPDIEKSLRASAIAWNSLADFDGFLEKGLQSNKEDKPSKNFCMVERNFL